MTERLLNKVYFSVRNMIIGSPDMKEVKLAFIERRREYGEVYTYIFRPKEPISFEAGQYGHVRLFGMPEGVRAVREFSFASAPHESDIWFGIDSRSGSPYQKRLQELNGGEEVGLFKIKGHMPWSPEGYTDVVMIAGGVGITPFRSQLMDRAHRKLPITTTLIHASQNEYLYENELLEIAREYRRIRREELQETIFGVIKEHTSAIYFIAGSVGFVESVNGILHSACVSSIKSDVFKGLSD